MSELLLSPMALSPQDRERMRLRVQRADRIRKPKKPAMRGFASLASDSWFSDEPSWKRVLISISNHQFLVYPDTLEACMHTVDVNDVKSVHIVNISNRTFELAAQSRVVSESSSLFGSDPTPPPVGSHSSGGGSNYASQSGQSVVTTVIERFRFRCDTEEELRDWVNATERWLDHWRSKSARVTVVENLLAQLDASSSPTSTFPSHSSPNNNNNSNVSTAAHERRIVNGDAGVQDLDAAAMDARTLSNQIVVLIHALEAQPVTSAVAATVRRLTQHYEHELKTAHESLQVAERERNAAKMREERIELALRKVADETITLKEALAQCKRELADTQSARDEVCRALVDAKLAAADQQQQHWTDMQRERKLRANSTGSTTPQQSQAPSRS